MQRTLGYWLSKNRLYLQVTNEAPAGCLTLYQARGPGFKIPGFQKIEHPPTAEEMADFVEEVYENDPRKVELAGVGMGVRFAFAFVFLEFELTYD